MRVLVVTPFSPCPPDWGAAMRVNQLVRHLSKEHSVTVLTYADPSGPPLASYADICEDVRLVRHSEHSGLTKRARQMASLFSRLPYHAGGLRSARMQAAIDDCLDTDRFDLVQVESSQMMCFRYRTKAPLVLDEHNIESELLRRQEHGERSRLRRRFNGFEARKQEALESLAWRRAAAVAVTSDREVPSLTARVPGVPVRVVPNAVDPDYFSPFREQPEAGTQGADTDSIVFTGLLHYRPNVDAIHHFLTTTFPLIRQRRPLAVVTVVGRGPQRELEDLRRMGALVTGRVPDLRPYLARAACAIAPIRLGGGTRLKVIEALSMATPIVSTSLGCEGINVRDKRHLLVADEPPAFAAAVCRLLENPRLGKQLGRAGRDLVIEQYSWRRSAHLLAELYDTLVTKDGETGDVANHRQGPILAAPKDRFSSSAK